MKLSKLSLTLLAAAGLLSLAPILQAQTNLPAKAAAHRAGARMSADGQLKTLTEQLSLTEDQKPKVKAALEEQIKARQAARDLAPEEKKAKAKATHEEITKKMKEVLTADQFKKYEAAQQGPKARRKTEVQAPASAAGGATKE